MRYEENRIAEHSPFKSIQHGGRATFCSHYPGSIDRSEGGKRERKGRKEAEKDNAFLLDKKVLTQFNRILGFLNVRALVEFEFPVLILTKLKTRKAKLSGLPTEMVSVLSGLWLLWLLLSARATAGEGLRPVHVPNTCQDCG